MSKHVKVKQIKKQIGDEESNAELEHMFEEMMGSCDAKKEIILPKFIQVRNFLLKIYLIMKQFSGIKDLDQDYPCLAEPLQELKNFTESLKSDLVLPDKEETESSYEDIPQDKLNVLYKKIKDHKYVRMCVAMCSRLTRYKKYIEDCEKLSDYFISLEPGLSFMIFDSFGCSLNLRKLWMEPKITPAFKKYFLCVLNKLYFITKDIYNVIVTPDIDIDEFSELLMNKIQQFERVPQLHRCTRAFNKIKNSVNLLKSNFSNYYKESIKCNNPGIIMESFIMDISQDGNADARLAFEFKQIINYIDEMRKHSSNKDNAKANKMMDILRKHTEAMEKYANEDQNTCCDDSNLKTETKKVTKKKSFSKNTQELKSNTNVNPAMDNPINENLTTKSNVSSEISQSVDTVKSSKTKKNHN